MIISSFLPSAAECINALYANSTTARVERIQMLEKLSVTRR